VADISLDMPTTIVGSFDEARVAEVLSNLTVVLSTSSRARGWERASP
jgi:hypothetical protein